MADLRGGRASPALGESRSYTFIIWCGECQSVTAPTRIFCPIPQPARLLDMKFQPCSLTQSAIIESCFVERCLLTSGRASSKRGGRDPLEIEVRIGNERRGNVALRVSPSVSVQNGVCAWSILWNLRKNDWICDVPSCGSVRAYPWEHRACVPQQAPSCEVRISTILRRH